MYLTFPTKKNIYLFLGWVNNGFDIELMKNAVISLYSTTYIKHVT